MLFAVAAAALLVGASAQSTLPQAASKLTYPPSRGSDPLTSRIGPCQGYEVGGRIEYPLSGGRFSWENIRDTNQVQLAWSRSTNPTSQGDFTPAGQNVSTSWVGTQCVAGPNFAELGFAAGDEVTVQMSYITGPGRWSMYECVDLRLVSASDYAALNMTIPCENHVLTTQTRSGANPELTRLRAEQAKEAEASAASSTSSGSGSGSGSRLTVTQAGIVGAMTTLGVCIIAILAAQVAGVAYFGKKAKAAQRAHFQQQGEKEVASLNSA